MLGFFVLGQVREARLSWKAGLVLESEELFERISMRQKRKMPDASQENLFYEIPAVQESIPQRNRSNAFEAEEMLARVGMLADHDATHWLSVLPSRRKT
jgi:hypothetical protein